MIRALRLLGAAGALLLLFNIAAATGGALPKQSILPLDLARQAASAAVAKCRSDGYSVSAAVVDRSGVLKVLLRSDDAGPHTVDSSRRKAYTAASLGRPTHAMAELVARQPEIAALREMNESILMLGGGLPIKLDGEIVGGIGVGGAPGATLDEACAREGLRRIGAEPQAVDGSK